MGSESVILVNEAKACTKSNYSKNPLPLISQYMNSENVYAELSVILRDLSLSWKKSETVLE